MYSKPCLCKGLRETNSFPEKNQGVNRQTVEDIFKSSQNVPKLSVCQQQISDKHVLLI